MEKKRVVRWKERVMERWKTGFCLISYCVLKSKQLQSTHTHIDFLPSVSKEVYKTQSTLQMSLIDRGQTPQRNKSHTWFMKKKQWWCWIVTDFKLSINTILVSKGRVWISQSILVLSASPRDKTYCSIFRVTVLSVRTNSVRVFWRLPLWNVLFKFFKCLNQHFERSP